ncbi:MAG: 2'-5' RNA ligase family protein [Defluviitaleaceae bacterium]|nr:2'-5' RNA ligase family protein [Defluviitaleaceae bacterium]
MQNLEYVFVLSFDEKTENYFNDIVDFIAKSGASSYMVDAKIQPHITIADFHTDNIATIINELENNICNFRAGFVRWGSIGSFVPQVLFAAPIVNEYLLNTCSKMNGFLKPLASHFGEHYLPLQWVPHTTLATRLDNDSLSKAFASVVQKFSPIEGECVRLELVQCNPYVEIKAWQLG